MEKLREQFKRETGYYPSFRSNPLVETFTHDYVEWLEKKLSEPKHETVEEICNNLLSVQTTVTILPNYIGNQPYSKSVIFPEQITLEYDRFVSNQHGKPNSIGER